ncbi:MAG: hypothetical protein JWO38_900 [Gemmataceae bacterium]|nr:hypothetical protein [Gemmataceae bacterium]
MIFRPVAEMLRSLFRAAPRSAGDEAAERVARLEHRVLALVGNMPTLPDVALRAVAMADEPASRFGDLARLIEGDAAITTGILRLANSCLYASSSAAVKLPQALVRLGTWQCKHLILSIAVRSLFRQIPAAAQGACEALWHHGYTTGALCRLINRAYRLGFDGEEFSAGLLHDLGLVLLVMADPDAFARIGGMDAREEGDRLGRERAAIGIDHCTLGSWFGEHSRLPDAVVGTVRFHHEPDRAGPNGRLVALVAAADHMADHLRLRGSAGTYTPDGNAGLVCLCAGWPAGRRERLLGEIPALMEEAVRAVGTDPSAS